MEMLTFFCMNFYDNDRKLEMGRGFGCTYRQGHAWASGIIEYERVR